MKEIKVRVISILLVKMSLFSICKSSCDLLGSSRFQLTTHSQLPLLLSICSIHFIGSFPSSVDGSFVLISKRAVNSIDHTADTVKNATKANSNATSTSTTPKDKVVKEKTLFIPDRTPANYTAPVVKDDADSNEIDEDGETIASISTYKLKAVERTLIVIAGFAVIILSYLGIKYFFKAKKFGGRYGMVETSEMDLLEKMEEEEEEESEEEELFDINSHRRRPF